MLPASAMLFVNFVLGRFALRHNVAKAALMIGIAMGASGRVSEGGGGCHQAGEKDGEDCFHRMWGWLVIGV